MTRMTVLLFNRVLEDPAGAKSQKTEKEYKLKRIKLSLLADDMFVYRKIPRNLQNFKTNK